MKLVGLFNKFITRYAWVILGLATVLVLLSAWFGSGVFGALSSNSTIEVKHTESSDVDQITQRDFAQANDSDAVLLYSAKHGTKVTDPAYKREVERLTAMLETTQVQDYYTVGESALMSRDKTKTVVYVKLKDGTDAEKYERLTTFRTNAKSDLLEVHTAGAIVSNEESNSRIEHDLVMAEMISLPILAVLLLFIFRGVIAALLPLLLGVIAIIGGLGMVRLLTHFTEIDQYSVNVITILGLGLSVDYSLLMVARFREELQGDTAPIVAVRRTLDKAGRTIMVSGLIVMASLLSLVVFPISLLRSVGLGGASALLVAMIAALTVLPAILVLLGKRINKWQIHVSKRRKQGSAWRYLGEHVTKRPVVISGLVLLGLLVIMTPILSMRFKPADYTILPRSSQTYIVFHTFATEFEGSQPPIELLYTSHDSLLSEDGIAKAYDFTHRLQTIEGVEKVDSLLTVDPTVNKQLYQQLYQSGQIPPKLREYQQQTVHGNTMKVTIHYKGEVESDSTQQLVERLRKLRADSADLKVGGQPAGHYDLIATVKKFAPYAALIITSTMFVLLALLLRSILIPLTAIIINTFALLASFGVLVWIFQWGNLTDVTWLSRTNGLEVTLPVLIFTVAFGLSMDYAVFLYSRIHEEYVKNKNNTSAILHGLEVTGPVITEAALLFFVVVAAFATSGIAMLQQIGIGLAFAVILDAFVVRIVFIPAVMTPLGKANWWWPGRGRHRSRNETKG